MKREQAIDIIKQIFMQYSRLEGKSIKLMPPRSNNALSDTFQIHIRANEDCFLANSLEKVVKVYNLEIAFKDGLAIIYKPYPDLKL